jgi:hypothetical protein
VTPFAFRVSASKRAEGEAEAARLNIKPNEFARRAYLAALPNTRASGGRVLTPATGRGELTIERDEG